MSSVYNYLPGGDLRSVQQRVFDFPSDIRIYAARADYTQSLERKAEFSAGIRYSYVCTDNQSNWFDQDRNTLTNNYSRSNQFRFTENINSVYMNLKKEWPCWSVQAGLRMENTNVNGYQYANPANTDSSFIKHYTSLFSSVFLLHKLDSAGDNTLVLSFSRRIRRPTYSQLNPFLFFRDQYL